jgi:hypothetical protein
MIIYGILRAAGLGFVKGARFKRRSALVRYVVTPFVGAALGSVGISAFWMFHELTGYRGARQPWAEPKPLAESWPPPNLVGLIAVITFFVLLVRAFVRRWRSADRLGL